jgi:hypothetical protein
LEKTDVFVGLFSDLEIYFAKYEERRKREGSLQLARNERSAIDVACSVRRRTELRFALNPDKTSVKLALDRSLRCLFTVPIPLKVVRQQTEEGAE